MIVDIFTMRGVYCPQTMPPLAHTTISFQQEYDYATNNNDIDLTWGVTLIQTKIWSKVLFCMIYTQLFPSPALHRVLPSVPSVNNELCGG